MRKIFSVNLAIFVMIAAIGFVVVSCEDEKPRDELFESQTGDYSIEVSNKSSMDLVAFAGSLTMANRIGGVTAKTDNFRLPKDPVIFPQNPRSFQMLFITRDQYEKNKHSASALAGLSNLVFIRTYVFWNGNSGDNTKVYEISDKLGGEFRLQIFGPGNYDVEFRENGVSGPTLGYAPKGMALTYLNVGPGNYLIFPVFQRYNSRRDIMETVIPTKPAEGNIPSQPFSYSFGFGPSTLANEKTMLLNLSDASSYLTTMKTGVVYVYINNALTGSGSGIRAYRGSIPLTTPHGEEIINNGQYREFAIMLPQQGSSYADSITTSFSIMYGTTQIPVVTAQSHGTANVISSYSLLADNMYTINITSENGVKAVIELRDTEEGGPKPFKPESDGTTGDDGSVTGLSAPQ